MLEACHLHLIGYRGSGKSTVGPILAARLGRAFIDLDERIESRTGRTIAEIFRAEGEGGFRDREAVELQLAAAERPSVLATGGGIVLRPANRELLKATGFVAWLTAPAEELLARIRADPTTAARRPHLTAGGGLQEVQALLAVREPLYAATADLAVPVLGNSPDAVAASVLEEWERWPGRPSNSTSSHDGRDGFRAE